MKSVLNQQNLKMALVVGRGETVDLETISEYEKPRGRGEIVIKAVVMENGSLNLKGGNEIGKKAVLTEAFLRQNILLLGEDAKATAVPELEIETDDVKASHAATVGQIDKEQLFYLTSRGISKGVATKMIVEAFLEEVLSQIDSKEAEKIRVKLERELSYGY
jgi:Fe-S cluster assembly scaffold protein SufB